MAVSSFSSTASSRVFLFGSAADVGCSVLDPEQPSLLLEKLSSVYEELKHELLDVTYLQFDGLHVEDETT